MDGGWNRKTMEIAIIKKMQGIIPKTQKSKPES